MSAVHTQDMPTRPMRRVKAVHFVGIGGVGMAGIAEVMLNLGYTVTGSDLRAGAATRRLSELGAIVRLGHASEHVSDADVVVTSTAVAKDNPEVVEAHARRVPVVRRAEMLAELMRFRYGIAIAGTHGKTTTTSLVASVLAEGELDPTFVVGGKLLSAGANARLGAGPYLVAEADESDASFLHLNPMIAVITNIDADHLETYGGDFERLRDTFVEFAHRLPFYGLAVVCLDDPNIAALVDTLGRPVTTYGILADADVTAEDVRIDGRGSHFRVRVRHADRDDETADIHLNLPGRHNVLNALAAVAVGRELDVPLEQIGKALTAFAGIGRRCEVVGELTVGSGTALLIDDYGHHPSELAATIAAMRDAWPGRRLVTVFQPHRYTRTRDLFDDFCRVLADVDPLVLTEVYAAGEPAINNADGRALARGIRARGKSSPVFVEAIDELVPALSDLLEPGDVVLTLGAGSIGNVPAQLMQALGAGGAA